MTDETVTTGCRPTGRSCFPDYWLQRGDGPSGGAQDPDFPGFWEWLLGIGEPSREREVGS
jgi:hypothetical protein